MLAAQAIKSRFRFVESLARPDGVLAAKGSLAPLFFFLTVIHKFLRLSSYLSMLVRGHPESIPSVSHSRSHIPDESTYLVNGQPLFTDSEFKSKTDLYLKMCSDRPFRTVNNHRESEGVETNGLGDHQSTIFLKRTQG